MAVGRSSSVSASARARSRRTRDGRLAPRLGHLERAREHRDAARCAALLPTSATPSPASARGSSGT